MKNRNPIAIILLPFITLGIYSIYWLVSTKIEMNKRGAKIPTAWLLIVPMVNLWWMWKYSEGVEYITSNKLSGALSFILLYLLGFIGQAIVQDSFNKIPVTEFTEGLGSMNPVAPTTSAEATPINDQNNNPPTPTNTATLV